MATTPKKIGMFKKINHGSANEGQESPKFPSQQLPPTHISTMSNSNSLYNDYLGLKKSGLTLPIDNTLSLVYEPYMEIDSSQLGSATNIFAIELNDSERSLNIQVPHQSTTQSTQSTLTTQNSITNSTLTNPITKTNLSITASENSKENDDSVRIAQVQPTLRTTQVQPNLRTTQVQVQDKKVENKIKETKVELIIPENQEKALKRISFSKQNNTLSPFTNKIVDNDMSLMDPDNKIKITCLEKVKNERKNKDQEINKEQKDELLIRRRSKTQPNCKQNLKCNFIPVENRSTTKSQEDTPDPLAELEARITKNRIEKRRSVSPLGPAFLDDQIFLDPSKAEQYLKGLNAEKQ